MLEHPRNLTITCAPTTTTILLLLLPLLIQRISAALSQPCFGEGVI